MNKIINPCKGKTYGGRSYNVFVEIEFNNGRLSFHGVEGPLPSGNAFGGCGQIQDELIHYEPCEGWDREMIQGLVDVWKAYHLNDLQAGCIHQQQMRWEYKTHEGRKCPICGYKIGSEWRSFEIPQDVIEWVRNLPESKVKPAWI